MGRLKRRWRLLTGPAPLGEFDDYDHYWHRRGVDQQIHRRWEVAASRIRDGATVLDVGCGGGEFLAFLRSRQPSAIVHGIDLSEVAVQRTRERGLSARRHNVADAEIGETYDYVTCFEVLEHIPDAENAFRNLLKAVKRELVISIPNVGSVGSRLRLGVFGRFPNTNCVLHIKEHVRHWTPKDFRDWVDNLGGVVLEAEGQYGMKGLPWRRLPSLFASGMIYVVGRRNSAPHADVSGSRRASHGPK